MVGTKKKIWYKFTMTETVLSLLEWRDGSGEEFHDWLSSSGFTGREAQDIIDKLEHAIAYRRVQAENIAREFKK